jgi:putrescine transport system substrate-binding protein
VEIRHFIPREGAIQSFDVIAIPVDAPHPQNAARWLNYLMRPEVIAAVSNYVKYPNGNRAALPFVDEAIRSDPAIYPDSETLGRLHMLVAPPSDYTRLVTRIWTRFVTGY